MKANGYGSFLQKIVILVPASEYDAIRKQLGITADDGESNEPMRTLTWTRRTGKLQKDEDVIFDLSVELGGLADKTNWKIDWAASHY